MVCLGLLGLVAQACTKDLLVAPAKSPQRGGGPVMIISETGETFRMREVCREVSASTVANTKFDSPLPGLTTLTDTSAWVQEVLGHCYQRVVMKCNTKTRVPYGILYTRQYCIPLTSDKDERKSKGK